MDSTIVVAVIGGISVVVVALIQRAVKEEDPSISLTDRMGIKTSAIPPIWNVPHLQNTNFTGRDELFKQLEKSLEEGQHAALTQTAIHGLGGVGKTQLATEYAYRKKNKYDLIWWLRCEETAKLAADYAALAIQLGFPEKITQAQDQRVAVDAVKHRLEQNTGWLLIFDNANNAEEILEYLPKGSREHVIITSCDDKWEGVAVPLKVEVFDREESIDFLLKTTGEDDREKAGKIADIFDNLPLGVAQAAAYIKEASTTLEDYLRLFNEYPSELLKKGKPLDYPDPVAKTWEMSFDNVSKINPAAAELLNICAFLAPDDIPIFIFRDGKEYLPEALKKTAENEIDFNNAINTLKRYSLIEEDDKKLSVHRIVQTATRDRMGEDEQKKFASAALEIVNTVFPFESDDVRTWPLCGALFPHAIHASGFSHKLGVALQGTGRLVNQAGLYLRGRAQYKDAKKVFELSLEITKAAYGEKHEKTATVINNIGSVLKAMGDFEGAKANYEKALEIGKKTYGDKHPDMAPRFNNLGAVLKDIGDLEGAKVNFEKALEIDRKAFGDDHHDVAIDLNNIGSVLKAQGDLEGAKANYEKALEIGEKVYEPNHPQIAIFTSNLGGVLKDMGDLEGAKVNIEKALGIDIKVFGEDHPNVAFDLNNLGSVLQDLGDLEGAKANFEKALKVFQKFLGDDHPNTKTVRKNLEIVKSRLKK